MLDRRRERYAIIDPLSLDASRKKICPIIQLPTELIVHGKSVCGVIFDEENKISNLILLLQRADYTSVILEKDRNS